MYFVCILACLEQLDCMYDALGIITDVRLMYSIWKACTGSLCSKSLSVQRFWYLKENTLIIPHDKYGFKAVSVLRLLL